VKTGKNTIVVGLAACLALFTIGGCSDEQLRQADRVFADVNNAGRLTRTVAESPEASLIPPPIRLALELLGLSGAAAFGIWQKIRASKILERKQDLSVTLKAIVDAIETTDARGQDAVKPRIEDLMKERGIYDLANTIVDAYKVPQNPDVA
jgi:hypothetical protein